MRYEKKLTIRVNNDLYDKIVKLADNEERTLSNMALILLRYGIISWEESKETKKINLL